MGVGLTGPLLSQNRTIGGMGRWPLAVRPGPAQGLNGFVTGRFVKGRAICGLADSAPFCADLRLVIPPSRISAAGFATWRRTNLRAAG